MSYEIRADYSKQWLLPPALEDFVPAGHPARLVRDLVDAMDLKELGFYVRTAKDGRPNYAADLLLKVWLYGYMTGTRELRRLERACREQLSLVWLTGMNYPDHNTLWRFFRDNRKVTKKVFKRVLKFAVDQDLVGVVLHAIDGTKILARGARDAVRSREKLSEVLTQLDQVVEEAMEQMEASAQDDGPGYELPASWRDDAIRREQVRELINRMEVEERDKIHPLEPEAQLMKTRNQGIAPGYNGQVVVDSESGLIVAEDLVTDPNDAYQLARMAEQVRETIGECAEQTVADGGYASANELARCEERQIEVLVNEKLASGETASGKYHASQFSYDEAGDRLICPEGKELKFERIQSKGKSGKEVRLYRGIGCESCTVRGACTSDRRGRSVGLDPNHGALQRQRLKRAKLEFQEMLRRRKAIVEAPFGFIKEPMRMRRFTMMGQVGAGAQWTMTCMAFNILKLLSKWRRGQLRLVAA